MYLISAFVILISTRKVLSGPACAHRYKQSEDCVTKCAQRWGWPGHTFGMDPWGSILTVSESPDVVIPAQACGTTSVPLPTMNTTSVVANPAASVQQTTVVQPTLSPWYSSTLSPMTGASVIPAYLSVSSSVTPSSSVAATSHTFSSSSFTSSRSSAVSAPSSHSAPSITLTSSDALVTSSVVSASSSSPPTTSSAASSPATSASDIDEYLSDHNSVRVQHGANPLTWSDDLAMKAQQWSNNCIFKHSGGSLGPFGENLAAGTGSGYGIDQAIKSWTDESSQYNPNNPQASHFTQVVWKSTTQVGCAVQECNGIFASSFGLAKFFVCEYSPQGNIIGSFSQNVQV